MSPSRLRSAMRQGRARFARGALGLSFLLLLRIAGAEPLSIMTEELYPAAYHDEQGKVSGWAIDVVSELEHRTGATAPIAFYPWARAYKIALTTPDVLIFTMVRNAEREPLFKWIGPISRSRVVLLGLPDAKKKIHGVDDAKALRIGIVNNDAKGDLVRKLGFANLNPVTSITQNYRMLLDRRIDAMVVANTFWQKQVRDLGYSTEQFAELVPLTDEIVSYLAFSQGTPDDTVRRWSDAFAAARNDGTLQKIYEAWGLGEVP